MNRRKGFALSLAAAATLAASVGLAAPSQAASLGTVSPDSGTSCSDTMCIFVNGSGLKVNYATVTNYSGVTERPYISSTYDGVTHVGPTRTNNASWRWDHEKRRQGLRIDGRFGRGLRVDSPLITPYCRSISKVGLRSDRPAGPRARCSAGAAASRPALVDAGWFQTIRPAQPFDMACSALRSGPACHPGLHYTC
jgi:hypothetical protein